MNKEDFQKIFNFLKKNFSKKISSSLLAVGLVIIFCFGIFTGGFYGDYLWSNFKKIVFQVNDYLNIFPQPSQEFSEDVSQETEEIPEPSQYVPQTIQEQAVMEAVQKFSPAVVSIIITKDIPIYEEYYEEPFKDFEEFFGPQIKIPQYRQKGTEEKTVGGGTGFIISEDGLILTNKHVVNQNDAEYTVITNEGERFSAEVLALDPFQDLAVLKIAEEREISGEGNLSEKSFPTVKLGNSNFLQIGQSVITIGNALGEFRNTVSVGVISGLGRTVTASGGGVVETLEDVIQTDAAINKGNSGGPLLNLKGEVIGVNVAMAQDAQSIGFAIPINQAKKSIEQVKEGGKIVYPFLGIRYILLNPEISAENNLDVESGALIIEGEEGEPAIIKDSAAEKVGLKEGDIILKVNNKEVSEENSLAEIIRTYQPGDRIFLEVLRGEEILSLEVVLGEKTS